VSTNLHRSDHTQWSREPDYNPDLPAPLAAAYACIKQAPDRVAGFREAGYQVVALRDQPMCAQQRMNVCYILAMAHAADDEHPQALSWLDQAIECARALVDWPAQLDLLFLHGFILQRIGQFDGALRDYHDALDLHAQLRRQRLPVDSEQELMLLIGAAGFALMQEDYDLTSSLFSIVRRVARRVPMSPLTAAFHDWLWAVYQHAGGRSERALQHALHAAQIFTEAGGNPHSIVLVHVFVSRVALDLAATHAAGSIGRLAHLKLVVLSLRKARKALAPNNLSGKGYIWIREAQLDALSGREARAPGRIQAAERVARQISDDILLVQALTAHGHVLALHEETWDAALSHYRQALAISEHSPFPLEGLPARRALRQLEEIHAVKVPT
jgi:tetratricopeptide (TPR) repeat protein